MKISVDPNTNTERVTADDTVQGEVYRRVYSDGSSEADDLWLSTDEDSMVALDTGALYDNDSFDDVSFVRVNATVSVE